MMSIRNNGEEVVIWIGTVHVRPKVGNDLLEGAVGAFVPAVGLGDDINDFVHALTVELQSYDFEVLEIADIEPFKERVNRFPVDKAILDLASSLSNNEPIALSQFEAYMQLPE